MSDDQNATVTASGSHRRRNPLTNEWVLVSPHRLDRPWQGARQSASKLLESGDAYDRECYLCRGNTRATGDANPDYAGVFVFDNDYPALSSSGAREPDSSHPLFQWSPTTGTCRVICFSPHHSQTLSHLSREAITAVVDEWAAQTEELSERYPNGSVQIFENKGELMGCSNPHPHGQVWAQHSIPTELERELSACKAYDERAGSVLLMDYASIELLRRERVVCQNEHFVALVPYWATWPFETLVCVKNRHVARVSELRANERQSFADILRRMSIRYDNLFGVSFPYSAGIHQAPGNGEWDSSFAMHMHFYPPLLRSAEVRKFMVGYEMLAEAQRDLTPEAAAEVLRQQSEILGEGLRRFVVIDREAVTSTAIEAFHRRFGVDDGTAVGWSPGRVNLIGEHTDYNNGYVLPMAIDLGVCVVLRPRAQPGVSGYAVEFGQTADFSLLTAEYSELTSWAQYLAGVAVLSMEAGCELSGFDAVVHGNLPIGGGVSSSAALTVASSLALQAATNWSLDGVATARLCQTVEHRFAGVQCGVMDQMACRLGQPDRAVFIDCASYEYLSVSISSCDVDVLIVDSGVPRSLHSSEYNKRGQECASAVEAIQQLGYEIESLRDVDEDMLAALESDMDATLFRRSRHVVTENRRVLVARSALESGDFETFGRLMNESHESLRVDFQVSIDELDLIVASACEQSGALGARLTGAGFGGNAVVLTRPEATEAVAKAIFDNFSARFERAPWMHRIGQSTAAYGERLGS